MTLASKITLLRLAFIPVYMLLMYLSGGQSGLWMFLALAVFIIASLTDFVDGQIDILSVLVASGLCASRNEARRAVEQGGVTVNDVKVADIKTAYTVSDFTEGLIVKRGKKNFRRVII